MKTLIYISFVAISFFFLQNKSEFRDINEALKTPLEARTLIINAGMGYDTITDLNRIGELKNLEELEISECAYVKALPNSITKLTKLRVLRFNWNGATGIDNWDAEFEKLAKLDSLEVLVLGYYNNLGHLSSKIGDLKNLRILYLRMTETQSLPKEIGSMTKLEYLDLGMTQIKELPKEIANLPNLKAIILVDSPLALDKDALQKARKLLKNCDLVIEPKQEYKEVGYWNAKD